MVRHKEKKMSSLEEIKAFIAALRARGDAAASLRRIELPEEQWDKLVREVGTAELVVDGVEVGKMSLRAELTAAAQFYAAVRWRVEMSREDVESLFKAVESDDEMQDLLAIMIDQHLDDHGYEDPVNSMDAGEVAEMKRKLKESGFDDAEIG